MRVIKQIEERRPSLIIGSPMCSVAKGHRVWCDSKEHMKFVSSVYRSQVEEKRWYMHEHPKYASADSLRQVEEETKQEGEEKIHRIIRHDTSFITNSNEIREGLKRCQGKETAEEKLLRRKGLWTKRYSKEDCKAICEGIQSELKAKAMSVKKLITVGRLMKVSEVNKGGDHAVESCNDSAWDDLTGEVLDPKEVRRARMKELGYIHQKRVWKNSPQGSDKEGI